MTDIKLKIVIVGHVDHGKSTLIGRLMYDTNSLPPDRMEELKKSSEELGRDMEFAFLMDHLQEEREQGITIDTAQTFFKTEKREYVIIDAPGHKEFLKNMITGASQAETAVLLVDVHEGVMEQTKRHVYILSMLGIDQVIVLMNKMDMIDYAEERFNEVRKNLLDFMKNLSMAPTFIIPISAKEGENVAKKSKQMSWYPGVTLLEALDTFSIQQAPVEKSLLFPIQDVCKVGTKRILTGRIESGRIHKGDEVFFLPSEKESIIDSIEIFLEDRTEAEAGESIGVTLQDPHFIERGEVICSKKNNPKAVNRLQANVFWMSPAPFNIQESLTIRLATQEVRCTVEKIKKKINSSTLETIQDDSDRLLATEVGTVIIKTKSPLVVTPFNEISELGRFVLVRDNDTVAGGIVIQK